jgi:ATP-dependent Clp protease ATP-binding subunit ClpC
LQVLDDGHITDSQGRKIDFKNTVIIMTSNAGAQRIVEPKQLGFLAKSDEKANHEMMKNNVMDEVHKLFKPEFLNRIDETIVFHALTKEDIRKIVDIMIRTVSKRTVSQMKIGIEVDEAAKDWLIEKGYEPKYGARPLRRTIQNEIEDNLAEEILNGNVKEGNQVLITLEEDKLKFTAKN